MTHQHTSASDDSHLKDQAMLRRLNFGKWSLESILEDSRKQRERRLAMGDAAPPIPNCLKD